ncbi:CHC2 zinc finger domain-containing protein [Cytobacillus sp. IB215665]|uniref:CHC2 zinc finger domain-containing protein n=1 Tax=Cytobacillus sp. IB215665 TaxID=3097357 RepID=UPI002A0AE1AD|nr:CHC2 zinc finger domain-containing protein [Cytobacillus sp. IB215665]MDX8367678.1 CHC2 zinc finger domain-containing protein [Cytobacillus sp. IB215665]
MCLPSILEIADRAGLQCDHRSRHKTEVMYDCPFCNHRSGKFKLSLNQRDNVFKCWLCGERGGVLQFESQVFQISYDEVKKKYFKNRTYHQAEMLSPKQLKKINWDDVKRRQREEFKRSLDQVLEDWKAHEYNQKVLAYAKILISIHLEGEIREQIFVNIYEQGEKEGIKDLFNIVFNEYFNDQKSDWAEEGTQLARAAWKTALIANDNNHIVYLLMLFYQTKSKNNSVSLKQAK